MVFTIAPERIGRALTIGFLLVSISLAGQSWELKNEEAGIKVYTRTVQKSHIKAIKVECTIEATLSQLTAVLLDIPASDEWVYATKFCRVQKTISSSELIYHSEIDVPWPANNRDFIVRMKLKQDSITKKLTVDGENLPHYLNEQEDVVRIMHTESNWTVTPRNKYLDIVFTLHVHPGGSIPAWLVNLFATRGPLETFRNLRSQVNKPEYKEASFSFLVD
ncbi:START domain-containing protein [Chryseolinea serpens]|uniref:START domain-containing protein n=1 Tax=Chryseolinea serpens TaxID=947013 RepID=A0A1M5MQ04_9BACT|nr:START domain-containing protein [Chryseolinea serpens]SHG79315.1 START domain-containing protein [Chryseolinea serpens]